MTTARIIDEADIIPDRASGYRLVRGELKNQEWVSPTINATADSGLYLSVIDLARWDAGLRPRRCWGGPASRRCGRRPAWTTAPPGPMASLGTRR